METSWGLPLLAEAYGKAGEVEEGLNVLVEALAVVRNNERKIVFVAPSTLRAGSKGSHGSSAR
jgi:hypothetical protein